MGVICHGPLPSFEKDITRINISPIYLEKNGLEKIIRIQQYYRRYKAKYNLLLLKEELKDKIFNELDEKKLIDLNKLLESKSEQYYNKLISSKKIKSFERLIKANNNNNLKGLNLIKKNSFNFPFNVQITEEKIYKGSWNFNKQFHGYGILYEFNKEKNRDSKTEGIFNNGYLNGLGRIFFSNEEMIIGNFIFNKLNGVGEYFRNDGSVYKGGFFDGLPQGNGQEFYKDGSKFTGFYLAGKKKHGKFLWKNGNFYDGDFHNDLFHGYGVYKWGNERTYEGNWKEGKMDGKGKLFLIDGTYYEGDFVAGKKSGKGKYFWNKDKYYDGEWKNDKQNGIGVYHKKGSILKGFWINGKLFSNYHKLNNNNNNITYLSPDSKQIDSIDERQNGKTIEYKQKVILSVNSSPIKREIKDIGYNNKTMMRNNTHIYISKKIYNKNSFHLKNNINLDNFKKVTKNSDGHDYININLKNN